MIVFLVPSVNIDKVIKYSEKCFCCQYVLSSLSLWPRGLRRGFTAARFLGLRARIPPVTWMSVCCECFVLSCSGFYDKPIIRPEESYRVWCVQLRVITEYRRGGLGPLHRTSHKDVYSLR